MTAEAREHRRLALSNGGELPLKRSRNRTGTGPRANHAAARGDDLEHVIRSNRGLPPRQAEPRILRPAQVGKSMHAVVRHLRPDTLDALHEQVVEQIDLCRKDLVNLPRLQCSSAFLSSRWALSALYTRHASCGLRLNVDVQLPGLSRAQITRLIQLYASGERL